MADEFSPNAKARVVTQPAASDRVLDIGPETVRKYADILKRARTIFWNGPMGVFEFERFSEGTKAVANIISEMTGEATTIIGGGDTLSAVEKAGVKGKFSHSSTGGGAMLELLEGKTLPGITALTEAAAR